MHGMFKKPSLKHVNNFCFESYVHVTNKNTSKLYDNIEQHILINYKDGIKGYKIQNLITINIFYNWDDVYRKEICSQIGSLRREKEPNIVNTELGDEESKSPK